MDKILCFKIESQNLYLDQILIDYNEFPIFFICKAEKEYRFALCVDIEKMEYYVTPTNLNEIDAMFSQTIPMRDVWENKDFYWHVIAGETTECDIVYKKSITEIDISALPDTDAVYEIYANDILDYSKRIKKLLRDEEFIPIKTIDVCKELWYMVVKSGVEKRDTSISFYDNSFEFDDSVIRLRVDRCSKFGASSTDDNDRIIAA